MKTTERSRIEITAIAHVLGPLAEDSTWEQWTLAVPIVSDLDKRARLHPLEKEALTHLPHLQHVCHHPRLHLRVEEERISVARARRIPARAAASLVAHPGDWEHRTLTGIRPARILATQIEDDWNLYENRMAARLVDHLLVRTSARLDELRRLEDMVRKGEDFTGQTRGSHRRAERLYQLWGRVFSDDAMQRELKDTLRAVERLQSALQALRESVLYTNVPRGAFVPTTLVPTNILANDPHYRKVAALWRAWVRYGHEAGPTPEELRRRRQEDRRSFESFVLLLVIQALHGLGYHADAETVISGPGSVELHGPLGDARLAVKDGAPRFEVDGCALHIVPRLAQLDREKASDLWRQISHEPRPPGESAVLLVGRPEQLEDLDPEIARAFGGWGHPRVLLVSAWSLDCTERLARVLRAWEAPIRLSRYPARAVVSPDPGVDLPRWLKRVAGEVAVVEPATEAELEGFERRCQEREEKLKREETDATRGKRPFDPGAQRALAALRRLAGKARDLRPWTTCPVCDTAGARFEHRPADARWERWAWWCRCGACSAEWGLHVCGSCARAFPVLSPNVPWPTGGEGASSISSVDRAFGRDLWAEPRLDRTGAFQCPRCDLGRELDATPTRGRTREDA